MYPLQGIGGCLKTRVFDRFFQETSEAFNNLSFSILLEKRLNLDN